ncbi:hypothetical protein J6590_067002, partial [Homalodisca vitripennis]
MNRKISRLYLSVADRHYRERTLLCHHRQRCSQASDDEELYLDIVNDLYTTYLPVDSELTPWKPDGGLEQTQPGALTRSESDM